MSEKTDIRIYCCETKISLNGNEIEKKELLVAGENLSECRSHFDEIWSAKK